MNVLVLTHTFPKSATDSTAPFMLDFAKSLKSAGAEVFVLTPYTDGMRVNYKGITIHTYKYIFPRSFHSLGYSRSMEADVGLKVINYLLIPFMIVSGLLHLMYYCRKYKIDVVNVHWILPNGLIAFFASFVNNIPYVVTLPGTDMFIMRKNKIFSYIASKIASRASYITSNNKYFIELLKKTGVTVQSQVISYPSSIEDYKPSRNTGLVFRKKYSLAKEDFIVLAAGRFVYKKGFEYLLQAFSKISNTRIKLILVGDGDLNAYYRDLVKKYRIENRVLFTGMVKKSELSDHINMADIMVTPSVIDTKGNVDGSPVTLVSSMACGIPQIITDVVGIAEELQDKKFITIVKQKNVEDLVKAIKKHYKNRTRLKVYGKQSRKYVLSHLSNEVIGRKYLEIFNSLL